MPSGRALTVAFIKKYMELKCLWKINDEDYRSKHKRLNAMKELLQILKKTDEKANIHTVRKKINTLRKCFNKEYNKVKASYRCGATDYEVHVPKLWYYDLLLFLVEKDSESKSSIGLNAAISETDRHISDSQDVNSSIMERAPSPSENSVITSSSEQTPQNSSNNSKRKRKYEASEVRAEIFESLDSSVSQTRPAFSAFGEHVAEKLRAMKSDAAKYCQKIINDAIFQAEFDNLNFTSRIVTDCLQHHILPTQMQLSCNSLHQ